VPSSPREEPGGKTGKRVLLLHRGRQAGARSPVDHRARGVPAGAEHRDGPLRGIEAPERPPEADRHPGPPQVPPPLATVERFDRKQVIAELASREHLGLDPSRGPDEHRLDFGIQLPERLRHGKGGHEVPTGAAAGDENASHHALPRTVREK
jgi:hypothetical protein